MRFTTCFALAGGLVCAGTIMAAAWPATTTSNVNVRSGPGVRYSVVNALPAGVPVDVLSCSGAWCQTQYGYVSSRLLAQNAAPGVAGAQLYGYPAAANPGTNYRQTYAPTAAGQPMQAYAPRAYAPPAAPYIAQPAAAPYSPAQPVHQEPSSGHPGQSETMSGARTTIGTANVRSGPGTEYSVVKTLPDFTKVEVQSCANAWCQTDEGYISLYLLSRGPVQQVLSPAAQPRIPGSATRDSSNYYGNVAGQAAMGYGAVGTGQQYAPQAYGAPAYASGTNYRQNFAPTAAGQAARAYAPNIPGQASAYGNAVTTANVNVRGGPGVSYGVLGSLPAGAPVNIVSCAGAWCQTQYGYISTRLLSRGGVGTAVPQVQQIVQPVQQPVQNYARSYAPAVQTAAPAITPLARSYAPAQPQSYAAPAQNNYAAAGYSAMTVSDLNVRSGPGMGYDVLNTLPAGSAVDVASCSGSWCQTQFGYVSARHLSTGDADPARIVVRPSRVTGGNYSNAAYVDPAYAGYSNAGTSNPIYNSQGFVPGPYPADNLLLDIAAAPFVGVAAAIDQAFGGINDGGYGYGYGNNWTASWGPRYFGPGYQGPGLRGRRGPAYWGARPSYWGGRPTYWNVHPGYRTYARFGDRQGDMYWSRRNEGRRPQAASFYGGRGGVGPYGLRPSYRPLLWQPRAGIY
ncbi:MAG TPA: SH3 domain-containing protein [Ancylobacter sp.]